MNAELLEAIRKRKKQMGGGEPDEPAQKEPPKSDIINHSSDFEGRKKNLEAFFAKKQGPVEEVPPPPK